MTRKTKAEIEAKSADYEKMLPYWQLTNDIVDGLAALIAHANTYLPQLPKEDNDTYAFRKRISQLTNVYRDIVETLASKPFGKEVILNDADTTLTDFCLDVDGSGNDLNSFLEQFLFYGLNSAICWLFIDFADVEHDPDAPVKTVAQAEAEGNRAYWSAVLPINVFDARTQMIAGAEVLTYIKIYEPGSPNRVRIIQRNDAGVVTFEVWKQIQDGGDYELEIAPKQISIDVIPCIPFYTGRRKGKSQRVNPMLRDAADLQLALFRKENDLNWAETMGAFPMITASGVKVAKDAMGVPLPLITGPSRVLISEPNGDGSVGEFDILEPSGSTFSHLLAKCERMINDLRELGKMPLTAQSNGITVITAAVAAGKAKTAVGACTLVLESVVEQAFEITQKWIGSPDANSNATITIDREWEGDIDESKDTDKGLLISLRDKRYITASTMYKGLIKRGTLPDDFDETKELDELAKELPTSSIDPLTGKQVIQ